MVASTKREEHAASLIKHNFINANNLIDDMTILFQLLYFYKF